jgi:biopolymer transport protein ExbD
VRIPTSQRSGGLGINMTPMIDVVFLLIIFFLVASHLARQENQLRLALPAAESGETMLDDTTPRVVLNVRPDGSLLYVGKPVDAAELEDRLAAEVARAGERLEIRVRGDRQVAYRHVAAVLRSCARAGAWNVTFAVYRPEDAPP